MTHADTFKFWSKINWSVQNVAIANVLNTDPSLVTYWRKKLGIPSPNRWKHLSTRTFEQYRKLDWKLQDIVLAERLGISRERVRLIRNRLGIPKSPLNGKMRPRVCPVCQSSALRPPSSALRPPSSALRPPSSPQ